jgi:hypothetical protein
MAALLVPAFADNTEREVTSLVQNVEEPAEQRDKKAALLE